MTRVKTGDKWPHQVSKSDLEITYFRGPGPGGQKRNKTSNACRIKHLPTGLYAQATEFNSQIQNKQAAFRKLAEQLVPLMKKEVQIERYRAGQERIRSYNQKDQRVSDERLDTTFSYDGVMWGSEIQEIIEELVELDIARRLKES